MINKNKIKEFWKKTLLEARQIPLQPTQIQLQESVPYIVEKITYKSLNGFLITCLLSKPAGKTNKLPAIITIPGYGGWEQSITLSECQRGYVILQVFPRKQGLSSKLRPGEKISGPGYLLQDIENPEGYFYQGAYIDVIRGIDYLATRGDVDTKRIGIMGTSQGGGIALSVSGIDSRIKTIVAHVPFFCDMRYNPAFKNTELNNPGYLDNFDYFDPVNLAPMGKAPVLLSSGGQDETCPAETIKSVFEKLRGIKALIHYPDLTHTSCTDFYLFSWNWMPLYL